MIVYFSFLLSIAAVVVMPGASHAQPSSNKPAGGRVHSAPTTVAAAASIERRAAADAEFNQARALFDDWCQKLQTSHDLDPRNAQVTMRLADCKRLNGQLPEADALLAKAEGLIGRAAMTAARTASDALLGIDEPRAAANFRVSEELWQQACKHFEASLHLDVSIATQLAVTACKIRSGEFAAARPLLSTAVAALISEAQSDSFHAVQLELGKALTRELNRLQPRITVKPHAGFMGTVAIMNQPAKALVPVLVDPGKRLVHVEFRDGHSETAEIDTHAAQVFEVVIEEPRRMRSRKRSIALWGLSLGSAVAAVASGAFYFSAQSQWHDLEGLCTRTSRFGGGVDCSNVVPEGKARKYNRTLNYFQGTVFGSGLLLAGALAVQLTTPKRETIRIGPSVAAGATGISASGTF